MTSIVLAARKVAVMAGPSAVASMMRPRAGSATDAESAYSAATARD